MPRVALYPGSFDPVTNGHLDVVRQAVGLCDKLIVAIGVHSGKTPLFSTDERLKMVQEVFAPVAANAGCGFEATTYDKLTVTAAQKTGATIMIRGLRDGTDLDYEMQLAGMNETMVPDVQTVFVLGSRPPDHGHTGPSNRRHGRRRIILCAGLGCRQPQGQIFRLMRSSMIRKSGSRFSEKHALGLDPRDHAQTKELEHDGDST
jgi:pantetheine-phosphate adenylyltransferase